MTFMVADKLIRVKQAPRTRPKLAEVAAAAPSGITVLACKGPAVQRPGKVEFPAPGSILAADENTGQTWWAPIDPKVSPETAAEALSVPPVSAPRTLTVEAPERPPTSNIRGRWDRTAAVAEWRGYGGQLGQTISGPYPPASVTFHARYQTGPYPDPTNLSDPVGKAIIDGLVDACVWPDDTAPWVVSGEHTVGQSATPRADKGVTTVHVRLVPMDAPKVAHLLLLVGELPSDWFDRHPYCHPSESEWMAGI